MRQPKKAILVRLMLPKITSFHCFGLWNIRTKRLQTEKVFLIVDILLLKRLNPTGVFWPRLQCLPFYYTTSVIHF